MRPITDPWGRGTLPYSSRTANYGRFIAPEVPQPSIETRRGLNIGDSGTTSPQITEPMMARMRNMLGIADDHVQGFIREGVYGQRPDGTYPNAFNSFMGEALHIPRQQYSQYENGTMGLIGSRALQAGGVTAAGVGLAQLTQQMAETFGGTGDSYGDETLYM